jgi:hypothetical protein
VRTLTVLHVSGHHAHAACLPQQLCSASRHTMYACVCSQCLLCRVAAELVRRLFAD